MSEKRFEIKADDVDSSIINITRDGEDFAWFLSDDITDKQVEKVCDLLNEQQKEINDLNQENADLLGDNIRSLDEFEKCTNKLKAKILQLQEENEQLKNKLNKGL